MSILDIFLARLASHPGRAAVIDGGGCATTFADLERRSADLARGWQRAGIGSGDRVLLALPVDGDLYASLAGLWRLGAVAVFPEPALGLAGLRHAARVTRPKAFLASGWYRALPLLAPELRACPVTIDLGGESAGPAPHSSLGPDHPALISFTSGSTGRPKAIVRSHGFLEAQHGAVRGLLEPTGETCVDLVAFPVFVLVNLALGVTSVLPAWKLTRHDRVGPADLAGQIARHGIRRALVPPVLAEVLSRMPGAAGLASVFTGGGPVYPDVLSRFAETSPTVGLTAVYGSTEAEPIAHVNLGDIAAADWEAMRNGAGLIAGPPVPETRLRLEGEEIVVTGAHVNKGYLDPADDASTKLRADGEVWHRTGDMGRLDARGRLWLLGRENGRVGRLYPFPIEAAARFWPGVARAALASSGGEPVLAIEGDATRLALWRRSAEQLGVGRVAALRQIPLDRRHRSKVDYQALGKAIGSSH